jgi:outer membrane protein
MERSILRFIALVSLTITQYTAAFEQGDVILASLIPSDSLSNTRVGNEPSADVLVDNKNRLGLYIAHFLTDNINIELLASNPFKHDVNFGPISPLVIGDKLGELTHIPPTATVNYDFNDASNNIQSYVGVGVNYTTSIDEQSTSADEAEGLDELYLGDFSTLAAEEEDYVPNDEWFVNGSMRWVNIDAEASFKRSGAQGSVNDIDIDIDIDPSEYAVTLDYHF